MAARSIRARLNRIVMLTTFVALTLAGSAMVVFDLQSFQQTWEADLLSQAELLGVATAPALSFNDRRVAQENLDLLKVRPNISAATVFDAEGRVFAGYPRGVAPEPVPAGVLAGVQVLDGQLLVLKDINVNGEHLGQVFLRARHERLDRLRRYLVVVALVVACSMLLAGLMSNRLVAAVTQPIQAVSGVARRIVAGRDYSLRATRTSDDEIGEVAIAFNEMLDELARREATLQLAHQETLDLNAQLEDRVRLRTAQLEAANRDLETANGELESFSYSASHDLRSPLHTIDSFSTLLHKALGDRLDDRSRHYLDRIRINARRMTELIDALLTLAHVSRARLERDPVDLAAMAWQTINQCREREPGRDAEVHVDAEMSAMADQTLLAQVMVNLIGNAWKFTSKVDRARIQVGALREPMGTTTYFVRDNGAGFDMAYAKQLFGAFQRLHGPAEFPGTGIGLATVHRIVTRHEGRVWAESTPGEGATFYFTLAAGAPAPQSRG